MGNLYTASISRYYSVCISTLPCSMYGFILFGLGCGFIVMFVIIQIKGAFFAGAFNG